MDLRLALAALALLSLLPALARCETFDGAADPRAIVFANSSIRFTVLTSRLIRMEYAQSGKFEDRPSLAFVNRRLPVPMFSTSWNGGVVSIKTSDLMLKYSGNGADFSAQNLQIDLTVNGKLVTWHYGDLNPG